MYQQPKYGQGQNIYGNQSNQNNQNKNYPQYNQNQKEPNGNQKNMSNQKYADLEIQTFFNDGKNTGISAKDLELKETLETITNQYMAVFSRVNELSNKFGQGNDNMYKTEMIKQDLAQVESYNGNEYQNFISQLYEISNVGSVVNLSYDKYKRDPNDGEQTLKKVISDFKYDIIKHINKNSPQETYKKINNYVTEKKNKEQRKDYYYNNKSNNYEQNNNMNPAPNQGSNYNPNRNTYQSYHSDKSNGNNNYYNNNYNNGGNNYGSGNSIYNNNRPIYNNPNGDNRNYQYPGYGYGNNNYNNNSDSMRVTFIINGRQITHSVNPYDSGEVLNLFATQEKENPKLYDKKGRYLGPNDLVDMKVKDIFADTEPVLNIY